MVLTCHSRLRIQKLLESATSKVDNDTILAARVKLRRDISKWRRTQLERFPCIHEQITKTNQEASSAQPETENLHLPSSMNQPMRAALGLDSLATIEFTLWEGQAHDALESLRIAIKTFNYNFQFKTDHVFGQGPNTRAQAFLWELSAGKVSAADKYRTAHTALIALGLPQDDPTLQPLSNDQLWAKDSSKPSRLGDTKKEDPWFWTVGRPAGLSPKEEQEWSLESMLIFKLLSYLTKIHCSGSR